MAQILDLELKTYEMHRKELIGKSGGKFVLIKDDQVVAVFDTELDAIRHGYDRFGNVPFLVKEIVEVETPLSFTSNLLRI